MVPRTPILLVNLSSSFASSFLSVLPILSHLQVGGQPVDVSFPPAGGWQAMLEKPVHDLLVALDQIVPVLKKALYFVLLKVNGRQQPMWNLLL